MYTPYQNFGYNPVFPTANQPYNFQNPNYMNGYYNQPQNPQNLSPNTMTNKIYVSDENDVRSRYLPPNSDYIFLDNDKPLLYQKIVDNKGQFEVKVFKISQNLPEKKEETAETDKLSGYAKTEEIEQVRAEIRQLIEKLSPRKVEGDANGSGTNQKV